MSRKSYERVLRTLIRKGAIIDYYVDHMKLENGMEEDFDFIDHKGAAAVVAELPDGRILMVRQYRNALDRETLELPAGGRTSREEPTDLTAMRELEEETGYTSDRIEFLLSLKSTVAFCNELIDVYAAQNLTGGKQHLDPDEFLNVEAHELDELIGMIYDGTIEDGKTIAGLLAYARKYR